MSPEKKQKWMKIRDAMNRGEDPQYGNQYSNKEDNRNTNMVKMEDEKENNSSNKKKSAKKTVTWESGNIWQPVRQQKMQRTALISDDEDSQGDPEKKTKNRLLVH